ncbi:hypothetical protein EVAR_94305_1 [Eumeta japonica]|uniref:Uncharacterized protein n=1 Tax=Eumeta variegata TaxID=151549 RepID=A0A4C1UFT7_EUMVA|nr:hypothetical protein EVAR_94305_1 [Eumeta japonica]
MVPRSACSLNSHAYPSYSALSYRPTGQRINNKAEIKESSNLKEKNAWPEAERAFVAQTLSWHTPSVRQERIGYEAEKDF